MNGEAELRLKKIQGQVVRILAVLDQLGAKIDVNTLLADNDVNTEEIRARKSRIIDAESGPA